MSARYTGMNGEKVTLRGIVQGVGMRPTIFRLARAAGLRGWVCNTGEGVDIQLWALPAQISDFIQALQHNLPRPARIERITRCALDAALTPPPDFSIQPSRGTAILTGVTADAATCPACLAELREPGNRRYHYPFTNCTLCGPRFSIVSAIPYDRANTSMRTFVLCPACQREFNAPEQRRFHAQPNACPLCGPTVWLEDAGGQCLADTSEKAITLAAEQIRAGRIIAIKGIGGFHLACDATNADAVNALRARKNRWHKAFAVMAKDIEQVNHYALVSAQEADLLQGHQAPVVLLNQHQPPALPEALSPGLATLGVVLPYSPLHHLLLDHLAGPIVLTSGNLSDAPQVIENAQAREQLHTLADAFLMHNRDILNRVDDSVVRVIAERPRLFRRARGYAPEPLPLPPGFEAADGILAMGADLKNTVCLLKQGQALVSQHIGDLHTPGAYADYEQTLQLYRTLFDVTLQHLAVDLHPGYRATATGQDWAERHTLPLTTVQHHHAHIASCMAEHGLPLTTAPVLGIALDGLGLGDNGTLWGGEFLLCDYRNSRRIGHLDEVALLGADAASREPWRNTVAHLLKLGCWQDLLASGQLPGELQAYLSGKPVAILEKMASNTINSPPTSSLGRLFDAVAAALGLCREQQHFEGQAAMLLEACAQRAAPTPTQKSPYPLTVVQHQGVYQIQLKQFWSALLTDLRAQVDTATIARGFHDSLASGLAALAIILATKHGTGTVVLSGGVMQNSLLCETLVPALRTAGLQVYLPERLPANDGGLALGQAVICAAQLLAHGETPSAQFSNNRVALY